MIIYVEINIFFRLFYKLNLGKFHLKGITIYLSICHPLTSPAPGRVRGRGPPFISHVRHSTTTLFFVKQSNDLGAACSPNEFQKYQNHMFLTFLVGTFSVTSAVK